MDAKTWTHRILKKIPRFEHETPSPFMPNSDSGSYLGTYVNKKGEDFIVFLENGIILSNEPNNIIFYKDITKKGAIEDKGDDFIKLYVKSGKVIEFKIKNQKDIFELSRFFSRVIEDLKK